MVKTVGIVSLSSGVIGEKFVEHEKKTGVKRLEEYGLTNLRKNSPASIGGEMNCAYN